MIIVSNAAIEIRIKSLSNVDGGNPFEFVNVDLYQMNLRVFITFLEDQNQPVFRNLNRFTIFFCQVLVPNSIYKNSGFCVNVHFIVLNT